MTTTTQVTMPPDEEPTSHQNPSPFFALPRELRDRIYHYVFQTHRFIHCAFPPQAPAPPSTPTPTFPIPGTLRDFQLRYRLPDTTSRAHSVSSTYDYSGAQSIWLLTSKTLMLEATAQFLRNAEWTRTAHALLVRPEPEGVRYPEKRHWTTRLPVDARRITSMELYVENLSNWEDPMHSYGTDSHPDLELVAETCKAHGFEIDTLRFVGHTYSFWQGGRGQICNGQVSNMFRNLRAMFDGISVRRWEFGVVDYPRTSYWALFEWDEGENGGVVRMVCCKRWVRIRRPDPPPDQDLEKLLPAGWVLKREVCGREECDGCYPVEKETWRDVVW